MLKQSGLSISQFEDLVSFGFEANKEKFNNEDLNRMKAWSYFYTLGLEPKNFSILKSINERSGDFIEFIKSLLPEDNIFFISSLVDFNEEYHWILKLIILLITNISDN